MQDRERGERTTKEQTMEHDEKHTQSTPAEEKTYAGMSRRTLCLGVGGAVVLFALGGVASIPAQAVVRPPGGQDEDAFISKCIRCSQCAEVCPHHVITPTHLEDGILNFRTPELSFESGYCDWCAEQNAGVPLCVNVCPTQALQTPAGATFENTILGIARINTQTCLAYRLTGCRACVDVCPLEALSLDSENRPLVDESLCNGCGACEAACVSLQAGSVMNTNERAIVVRPISREA